MNTRKLASSLLTWYRGVRRDLPWRKTQDPYHIWVSEIMLQQTRVEAVIPFYERFLKRFPDMESLSVASEDELISAWQGLGYYSRARNLQRGVREVMCSYGGRLPDQLEQIRALPGIGAYTAGALLSIAYGKKEIAVDGNVLRVLSRILDIRKPVEQAQTRRMIELAVRQMVPDDQPGEFNQALMELGALQCIPGNPRCAGCPWNEDCAARLAGVQNELPIRRTPTRQKAIQVWAGILCVDERILARRRPDGGLLAGMWEFPSVEWDNVVASEKLMKAALLAEFRNNGQIVRLVERWAQVVHGFSHRAWTVSAWRCVARQIADPPQGNCHWIALRDIETYNWGGPYRKLVVDWISDYKRG